MTDDMKAQEQIDTAKLVKQKSIKPQEVKPYITSDFQLAQFSLTLVYNSTDKQGIYIHSNQLAISFQKFDTKYNSHPNAYQLSCQNKDFGVYSIGQDLKDTAIIEKLAVAS